MVIGELCLEVVIGELRFRGWLLVCYVWEHLLVSYVLEGGYWCVMSGSSHW